MDVALLDPEAHHRLEEEQQTMRLVVVLGETSLICAVLYFAAIGYKHLFAVWPWHGLTFRQ